MLRREAFLYILALAGCLLISVLAAFTTLGHQLDNDVYDFLFRISPAASADSQAVILGIDERTLNRMGGLAGIRRILADGIFRLAEARPKAVALDMILAESGRDPSEDARLADAFSRLPHLVLATDLTEHGWEDVLPLFAAKAAAVGHVHADPDPFDNVLRQIPLEKAGGPRRHFALSLEMHRLARPVRQIIESPESLQLDGTVIPARQSDSRPMRVRFLPPGNIPQVTFHQLEQDPAASAAALAGKAVFIGLTAQSAARDRHMTPYSYGQTMVGVEINANAYETLRRGLFLVDASPSAVLGLSFLLTLVAGLAFWLRSGWSAYLLGAALLAAAHLAPYIAFQRHIVFPYVMPISAAWLSIAAAASFQHFIVRRRLERSEAAKERYQKAIHFVAHEMRSPLSAIQGSSELMGRYQLSEEKRSEMTRMIHSESKRLARMIQTFLDVERLSEGQMELKREPVPAAELIDVCLDRVRPLAERKRIRLTLDTFEPATLAGDRELIEYAVYNLLTNAVKYSNPDTEVTVSGRLANRSLHLAVQDQGIGMDEKELRNIFRKFYRTSKAEASGEAGTGIGLSIVEQIVTHHAGRMEVTSKPGAGSCFTIILPVMPS
ncbi:MAG: CHASE2 domain-containing protein [Acidimicrobiia bacterium]|nr:CHASE2 domain-containing protein [Acidimicrobiia bacterium]